MKTFKFGISLYLGSGYEKNLEVVKKANQANIRYAFTSLHIPEEAVTNYQEEVKRLLDLCKKYQLHLLVDIGPRTIEKLGVSSIHELKKYNITHLRLDYGFDYDEIAELSKEFSIVYNASTMSNRDLEELKIRKVDFNKIAACHNYYPKPLTGISLKKVKEINCSLKQYGVQTMAFASGDYELRGPLKLGLPTVEEFRNQEVLIQMLELFYADTDVCFIGDIDCKPSTYQQIQNLSEGYIALESDLISEYQFIKNSIHHDRPDSSEYVIRSQESRIYSSQGKVIAPLAKQKRIEGSISIGNEKYLRYSGEVEIARRDLPMEEKVNIIGKIKEKDLNYLPFIRDGMGFKFVISNH